ncbi:MAG TPA: hypothetical protein VGN35_10600 [Jatrophihabitantaceae bacterium]|jgi:hypothetical protein|nr:hypothetical protein [Jatrophihabitantaceae bacterium]
MFGSNVAQRPVTRFSGRFRPHHDKPRRIVLTDDEQFEVYTDLATLLSLSENDSRDASTR